MNESERLEALEKEITRLKLQLSHKEVYVSILRPWERVQSYIESESIKRYGKKYDRDRWLYYESVRNAVKSSLNLKHVRNLEEERVDLAIKIAKNVMRAMDIDNYQNIKELVEREG